MPPGILFSCWTADPVIQGISARTENRLNTADNIAYDNWHQLRCGLIVETVQELQHAKIECRIIGSLDCFCQQFASFKLLLCCHLVIFPFRFGSTVPVIVTLQLKYSSKASTSSRVSRTSLIVIGARISKLSVGNSTFTRFLSSPFGPRLVAADAGCCRAQAYCGESIQLSRIPALTETGSRLPQAGCARSQFSRGSRR